jgi:hypothetical protein
VADRHGPDRPRLPPRVAGQTARLIRDLRRTTGPTRLTPLEEHVLDTRRDQADTTDPPSRRLPTRIQHATDRWSIAASNIALGLTNATVTTPPQRPDRTGIRAGTSDPTAAAVDATLHHIDLCTERYIHLASPCLLDGQHDRGDGRCPGPHAIDLGDHPGIHLNADQQTDQILANTPGSHPWQHAIHALASWHTITAATLLDLWQTAWRGQAAPHLAETSALEAWVTDTQELVRRLERLAGELAQWAAVAPPRICKHPGCHGAAEAGRRECGACRNRQHRERTAG